MHVANSKLPLNETSIAFCSNVCLSLSFSLRLFFSFHVYLEFVPRWTCTKLYLLNKNKIQFKWIWYNSIYYIYAHRAMPMDKLNVMWSVCAHICSEHTWICRHWGRGSSTPHPHNWLCLNVSFYLKKKKVSVDHVRIIIILLVLLPQCTEYIYLKKEKCWWWRYGIGLNTKEYWGIIAFCSFSSIARGLKRDLKHTHTVISLRCEIWLLFLFLKVNQFLSSAIIRWERKDKEEEEEKNQMIIKK